MEEAAHEAKLSRVHENHNVAWQVYFFKKNSQNENVPWSGYIQATLSKQTTLNCGWVHTGQIALRPTARGKLCYIDFMKFRMSSHAVKKNSVRGEKILKSYLNVATR